MQDGMVQYRFQVKMEEINITMDTMVLVSKLRISIFVQLLDYQLKFIIMISKQ